MPQLSLVYSIFNRSKLFQRGLETIASQTFPLNELEVVVVDDGSTEDIKKLLKKFPQLNFRYVRYDHTRHPIWQELNPDGVEREWYHTQAISANIGIKKATADFVCISQPEMLHAPNNLSRGLEIARTGRQVFAELWLATDRFNQYMDIKKNRSKPFPDIFAKATEFGTEYPFEPPSNHLYWYIQFFPKQPALAIGGVDEEYLRGVYAEDDNFKSRLRMAGIEEFYAGRHDTTNPPTGSDHIIGIHQSHYYERTLYPKQNRDGSMWNKGAETNRRRWTQWCAGPQIKANEDRDWGSELLVIEDVQI